MPRVYEHKFDWDESQRLRREGLTYRTIGERMGVSSTAIALVCNPHTREKFKKRSSEWQKQGTCSVCGGPASQNRSRAPYPCKACASEKQALVTNEEAWCVSCKTWLPHNSFGTATKKRGRYNLRSFCRACEAAARRKYRAENREQ